MQHFEITLNLFFQSLLSWRWRGSVQDIRAINRPLKCWRYESFFCSGDVLLKTNLAFFDRGGFAFLSLFKRMSLIQWVSKWLQIWPRLMWWVLFSKRTADLIAKLKKNRYVLLIYDARHKSNRFSDRILKNITWGANFLWLSQCTVAPATSGYYLFWDNLYKYLLYVRVKCCSWSIACWAKLQLQIQRNGSFFSWDFNEAVYRGASV